MKILFTFLVSCCVFGTIFAGTNRQGVMDDAYTFFDAEPVKAYDSKIRLQKDIGWYMKSNLRILGTFPARSAFKVVVRKGNQEQSTVRCDGDIYRKDTDINIRSEIKRRGRDLSYDDYMTSGLRCFDKEAVNKATGEMDVEVFFIDGDTDEEKLVRTYKIDVRKATRVRGSASRPQPDVSHYYIQRHTDAAVAVAYMQQSNVRGTYYKKPIDNLGSVTHRQLYVYTSFTPQQKYVSTTGSFARCSVNGQRINFAQNLGRDQVGINEDQSRREFGIYTDRKAAKYKRGSAYKDEVEFSGLSFRFPIYTGKVNTSAKAVRLEDNPGSWECAVKAKGQTIRTFRWNVENGKIVPHPEQKNGNVNLFYDAAIVDMEHPAGGSMIDYRLMPSVAKGFFYGIQWSTPEGKAMAGRLPKKGNPFHVPSQK